MPQIGAVLVPINYRLTADDFVYIINHSGSSVVCAHSDYLEMLDAVRDQMPGVRHYVAYEGVPAGRLDRLRGGDRRRRPGLHPARDRRA